MPLLGHFRPPLSTRRHWHSFHNAWATYLASWLNDLLPDGFFAEPNVQFGIAIDVAAFDERAPELSALAGQWQSPAPTQTLPLTVTGDHVEVLIFGREEGPTLSAAIELVNLKPAGRTGIVRRLRLRTLRIQRRSTR